jgi:hypothetical protein
MYLLKYKILHIVQEPLTKNRTHQTHRWVHYCMCEEEKALVELRSKMDKPEEWYIEKLAF